MVFLKKYRIDVRENMIEEWSKLQQMTEEADGDVLVRQDIATLGLTDLMTRLTAIAAELRQKMTDRSAGLPAQKAMKQAREAVYPEYRALILLLNAFAVTDSEPDRYAALISQLNNNIDYVKIHAMTKGTASEDEGGDEPTPTPTPTPTPDPSGGGDVDGTGGDE